MLFLFAVCISKIDFGVVSCKRLRLGICFEIGEDKSMLLQPDGSDLLKLHVSGSALDRYHGVLGAATGL